jgi:hypothetical protein
MATDGRGGICKAAGYSIWFPALFVLGGDCDRRAPQAGFFDRMIPLSDHCDERAAEFQ